MWFFAIFVWNLRIFLISSGFFYKGISPIVYLCLVIIKALSLSRCYTMPPTFESYEFTIARLFSDIFDKIPCHILYHLHISGWKKIRTAHFRHKFTIKSPFSQKMNNHNLHFCRLVYGFARKCRNIIFLFDFGRNMKRGDVTNEIIVDYTPPINCH